ncbi:MAG: glycosyltransferase [Candidatus Heimdallarchaeaceae archaeon]
MGFIFETLYILVVSSCFIYLANIIKNSRNGWEYLNLQDYELPLVSVIVPTLEEENNIGKCLKSLIALDYPNLEIIVVDGGSKDKTIDIAKEYGVTVIVDENLPGGWVGKSYGCHLGYQASKGEILLFTDADTEHTPKSLKITVEHLLSSETALLSLFPYQKAEKWFEYLVGFMYFLSYIGGGPRDKINNPYDKSAYMASGQYMLFSRKGYERLGGHLAISSSLVEDVALAKLCKEKEQKLYFIDNTKIVSTRMYPGEFIDFYNAFKRAIWGGITTLPFWRVMFVIFWLIYCLTAPYFLVMSIINPTSWLIWDFSVGIIVNIVLYLTWGVTYYLYWRKRGKNNAIFVLLYPIAMAVVITIILLSLLNGALGNKVSWRNRYYSTKPEKKQTLSEISSEALKDTKKKGKVSKDFQLDLEIFS